MYLYRKICCVVLFARQQKPYHEYAKCEQWHFRLYSRAERFQVVFLFSMHSSSSSTIHLILLFDRVWQPAFVIQPPLNWIGIIFCYVCAFINRIQLNSNDSEMFFARNAHENEYLLCMKYGMYWHLLLLYNSNSFQCIDVDWLCDNGVCHMAILITVFDYI